MMSWGNLTRLSDLIGKPSDAGNRAETITPMRPANVVTLDGHRTRKSVPMRWGLVPSWETDPLTAKKHIHARSETIDTKKAFRDAFEHRRGLLIVSTFNEGKEITPTKTEQHVLTPKDGQPVGIAVIWERWTGRDDGPLLTFAMVTVPPNPLIATITDRMPALLHEADWAKWLGEEPLSVEELKALLRPAERELDMQRQGKPSPAPKPPKPPSDESQPSLF